MVPKPNSRTHTKAAPTILPYRDPSNQLQYTIHPSALNTSNPNSPAFPSQLVPPSAEQAYDSDAEPLIPTTSMDVGEDLDPDALQRFTATGKPMPVYRHSAFLSMTDMYSLPQLLPRRYTDESVIPAIITGVLPGDGPSSHPSDSSPVQDEGECGSGERRASVSGGEKKKGLFGKLRRKSKDEGKEKEKGVTKVVYMPRREYLKYFARDLKGAYVGSEPYRRWTEGELEKEFAQYKPEVPVKTGYRVPT